VKEDKTVGIMTDDEAFGWKKKKVPEIKEELKRHCSFRRAYLHRAEPSRAE